MSYLVIIVTVGSRKLKLLWTRYVRAFQSEIRHFYNTKMTVQWADPALTGIPWEWYLGNIEYWHFVHCSIT